MDRIKESLVTEAAAAWLQRLPSATPAVKAEFVTWLKKSPLHVREILLAAAWNDEIGRLDLTQKIDEESLVANLSRNAVTVQPGRGTESTSHSDHAQPRRAFGSLSARNGLPWKIAAAVVGITLVGLLGRALTTSEAPDRNVVTAASEWRKLALEDGSSANLGPRTRLSIEFDRTQRSIRLLSGEAIFDVAKDTKRPFLVETHLAVVRAVGTKFGVDRLDDRVIVTVAEGTVAIDRTARAGEQTQSVMLSMGEQVAVMNAAPLAIKRVDPGKALAWEDGWLMFENSTVAQAVAEFNRRNRTQIEVRDPELASQPMRGGFRVSEPEAFAKFLKSMARDSNLVATREVSDR
jgi:transmembrane sensor